MKKIIIPLYFLLISSCAFADMFAPRPYCNAPIKPYTFNNQWEIDRFESDVERYKLCITDFVKKQQDAIDVHSKAAQDAIDQWNSFVNRLSW